MLPVGAVGAVNGWCERVPAVLLRVEGEHREVDDPQHVVAAGGHEVPALGEVQAQRAERVGRDGLLVGDREQQVAGLGIERGS